MISMFDIVRYQPRMRIKLRLTGAAKVTVHSGLSLTCYSCLWPLEGSSCSGPRRCWSLPDCFALMSICRRRSCQKRRAAQRATSACTCTWSTSEQAEASCSSCSFFHSMLSLMWVNSRPPFLPRKPPDSERYNEGRKWSQVLYCLKTVSAYFLRSHLFCRTGGLLTGETFLVLLLLFFSITHRCIFFFALMSYKKNRKSIAFVYQRKWNAFLTGNGRQ